MKKWFNGDGSVGVVGAASANLAFAAVGGVMPNVQTILSILVSVGQVGVAAVTIYYIWKKARAVKLPKEKDSNDD